MALKIRRTGGSDYGKHIKMLVVGPPGSGKTRLGATSPGPLIADCEGGLMSVADQKVPYVTIETTLDLLQLKAGLEQGPQTQKEMLGLSPETIIIDTIDEVQRMHVRERLRETSKDTLTMQDFGWLKDRMLDVIRSYRNLPMNCIFLCHSKDVSDEETGTIYTKPGLQGAVADEIAAYMDIVGLLGVEEFMDVDDGEAVKKVRYVMRLQPDNHVSWLKDRSGKLPAKIVLNGQTDFKRIVATVFADVPEDATEEMTVAPVPEKDPIEVIERKPEQPADPTKAEKKKAPAKKAETAEDSDKTDNDNDKTQEKATA